MTATKRPEAARGEGDRLRVITRDDFYRAADDALITWGFLACLAVLGALFFLSILLGGWLYAAANGSAT